MPTELLRSTREEKKEKEKHSFDSIYSTQKSLLFLKMPYIFLIEKLGYLKKINLRSSE